MISSFTTLGLGGKAQALVEVETREELVSRFSPSVGPVLLLGGGSNVVVSDGGFDGTVLLVRTPGIRREGSTLTVEAGEVWDDVVVRAVADGLSGIEALSGIPGRTGATPIQNVGAYGQEVAQTVTAIEALDRRTGEVLTLPREALAFSYRHSVLKANPDRYVVLAVTFRLEESALSAPVRYAELATALDITVGDRAPLQDVRDAVLALRRGKGMVLDPADPDTRSAGSFFTNPIVDAATAEAVAVRADAAPPQWPEPDGRVKLSAAWLVQHAGFARGYGDDRARISTKHTLALTSPRGGTTADLLRLAREVRDGVRDRLGVTLVPEPVFVGVEL